VYATTASSARIFSWAVRGCSVLGAIVGSSRPIVTWSPPTIGAVDHGGLPVREARRVRRISVNREVVDRTPHPEQKLRRSEVQP
jgi:hypothetical protein